MPSRIRAAFDVMVDAINRRDADTAVSVCDAEIEFSSALASVDGRPFRGHEGIREYFRQVEAAWSEWRVELEQVEERPDRLAAVFTMHAAGRSSGAAFTQRIGHVWEFRDARLWRCTSFRDPADALANVDADDPRTSSAG